VESILGKNMELLSRNNKLTPHNVSQNDDVKIEPFTASNFFDKGANPYMNYKRQVRSKENNENSRQNKSFTNNSLVKKRNCDSVDKRNDLLMSQTSSSYKYFFRELNDDDRINFKETLTKILDQNLKSNTINKDSISDIINEVFDNLTKSKASTRDDSYKQTVSSKNDDNNIENMHYTFVSFYHKYKKIVVNQENACNSFPFTSNDETVVVCDEVDLS